MMSVCEKMVCSRACVLLFSREAVNHPTNKEHNWSSPSPSPSPPSSLPPLSPAKLPPSSPHLSPTRAIASPPTRHHPPTPTDHPPSDSAPQPTPTPVDELYFEVRLALELHHLRLCERVFPLWMGDYRKGNNTLGDYWATGCHPVAHDEVEGIEEVERKVKGKVGWMEEGMEGKEEEKMSLEMEGKVVEKVEGTVKVKVEGRMARTEQEVVRCMAAQGLGWPSFADSVDRLLGRVATHPGCALQGPYEAAFDAAVDAIVQSVGYASLGGLSPGGEISPRGGVRALKQQVQAERAERIRLDDLTIRLGAENTVLEEANNLLGVENRGLRGKLDVLMGALRRPITASVPATASPSATATATATASASSRGLTATSSKTVGGIFGQSGAPGTPRTPRTAGMGTAPSSPSRFPSPTRPRPHTTAGTPGPATTAAGDRRKQQYT